MSSVAHHILFASIEATSTYRHSTLVAHSTPCVSIVAIQSCNRVDRRCHACRATWFDPIARLIFEQARILLRAPFVNIGLLFIIIPSHTLCYLSVARTPILDITMRRVRSLCPAPNTVYMTVPNRWFCLLYLLLCLCLPQLALQNPVTNYVCAPACVSAPRSRRPCPPRLQQSSSKDTPQGESQRGQLRPIHSRPCGALSRRR